MKFPKKNLLNEGNISVKKPLKNARLQFKLNDETCVKLKNNSLPKKTGWERTKSQRKRGRSKAKSKGRNTRREERRGNRERRKATEEERTEENEKRDRDKETSPEAFPE